MLPPFAENSALFLDVDGTLLDFAERPQDVAIRPEILDVMQVLKQRLPLAIVSGRRIADLDRLFAPLILPIAGQHGAERRAATGRTTCLDLPRVALEQARDRMQRWARSHPGVLVEDKGFTLALHYRRAPQRQNDAAHAASDAARILGDGYEVIAGNMVYEIHPAGWTKGRAIENFMAEAPFHSRVPIFIGDDVTDEDGFVFVNRTGGCSFKVGGGVSAARWRIDGVADVLAWLRQYADWLGSHAEA